MSTVLRFAANTVGRDLVVGDIHGCTAKLHNAMRACDFRPDVDRLFSVGDLIDRGPNSLGALSLLDEPWFHAVMGNHEWMLIASLTGNLDRQSWRDNGGEWADNLPPEQLSSIAIKLAGLPLAIVVEAGPHPMDARRFNVLHAEFFGDDAALDTGKFRESVAESMLWGRAILKYGKEDDPKLSLTCVGHSIVRLAQKRGSHLFIDTGAYTLSGRITIVEPRTGREWCSS